MKDIAVIIPTKYQSDLLDGLLDTLLSNRIHILVITDDTLSDISGPTFFGGEGLFNRYFGLATSKHTTVYQKWNLGVEYVREKWPEVRDIAILNDDIIIDRHTMEVLSNWLRVDEEIAVVYPDYTALHDTHDYKLMYTTSTFGAGGMSGFCFMFKAELPIPPIDENFELYWGDDDFVKQVEKLGYRIARVKGLPITHVGGQTISKMDSTRRFEMMEKDRAYFQTKYGERRERVY